MWQNLRIKLQFIEQCFTYSIKKFLCLVSLPQFFEEESKNTETVNIAMASNNKTVFLKKYTARTKEKVGK